MKQKTGLSKKLLSLLLTAMMVITAFPLTAITSFAEVSGEYEYSLLSNGTACIDKYTGSSESVTVPGTIDGYTVSTIGRSAFYGISGLKKIILSNGITTIKEMAFQECYDLETVSIPASVSSIPSTNPFMCTGSLKSITVDSSNTKYCSEDGVLYNKDKTELIAYPCAKTDATFIVPDSVDVINTYSCYGAQFTTVNIPGTTDLIKTCAFEACMNLTTVNIGMHGTYAGWYNLETIEANAFGEEWVCGNLNTINYAGKIEDFEMIAPKSAIPDGVVIVCSDGQITWENDGEPNDPGAGDAHDPFEYKYVGSIHLEDSGTISANGNSSLFYAYEYYCEGQADIVYTADAAADTIGAVYRIDDPDSWTLIAQDDDGGENNNFKISFTAEEGNVYLLLSRYYDTETIGSYNILLTADDANEPEEDGRTYLGELFVNCPETAENVCAGQSSYYSFYPEEDGTYYFYSLCHEEGECSDPFASVEDDEGNVFASDDDGWTYGGNA